MEQFEDDERIYFAAKDVDFERKLIECVSENAILFDKSCRGFRDKSKKVETWKIIGGKTGRKAEDCEKRWITLRQRFTRELKKEDSPSSNGSVDKWIHFQGMLFLKDHVKPRPAVNNIDMDDDATCSYRDETLESAAASEASSYEQALLSSSPAKKQQATSPIKRCLVEKFEEKLEEAFNKPAVVAELSQPTAINTAFMTFIIAILGELPRNVQDEARAGILELINNYRRLYVHK